jgi:hypothetical protein
MSRRGDISRLERSRDQRYQQQRFCANVRLALRVGGLDAERLEARYPSREFYTRIDCDANSGIIAARIMQSVGLLISVRGVGGWGGLINGEKGLDQT